MFNKKGVAIMTLMIIGLIAGAIALGGFALWSNGSPQDVHITYGSESQSLIPQGLEEKAIIFNNITLVDSTVFDEETNTCTATRHGMVLKIHPCVANDVDARDIQHVVNFTWNGGASQDTSWVFVYEGELEKGSMDLWKNTSYQTQVPGFQWISNHLIDGVVSYQDLGTPSGYCNLGSLNNTQMYNVTRISQNQTTFNQIICFTSAIPVNATAFRVSGNIDVMQEVTAYRMQWEDITSEIEYMGYGLLDDNRSYYQVQNVSFQPGQTYSTLWTYTPENKIDKGKWHILGYDTSEGLVNSIVNDQYIYVDPWWDNSWNSKKPIYLNTTQTIVNASILINVTYDADMLTNFGDLRFLDSSETQELGYWFYNNTFISSNSVQVWVRIPTTLSPATNMTIYMYYNNPVVSTTSDLEDAFVFGDDFDEVSVDFTNRWASDGTGSYATANGELVASATTTANIFSSKNSLGVNYRWEWRAKTDDSNTDGGYFLVSTPAKNYANADHVDIFSNSFRFIGFSSSSGGTSSPNVFYRMQGALNGSSLSMNVSSDARSQIIVASGTATTTADFLELVQYNGGGANSAKIFADWVYVRPYISVEPVYSFGSEELNSGITVLLNSPIDNFVTPFSTLNVTANVSVSGSTLIANATARIYNSGDALVQTIFNNTIAGMIQANVTFPVSTLSQGNYKWAVEARGDGNEVASTANRTFIIDQTNPIVNLTILDRYPVTDTFPTNISFFLNASDAQLQSCFYEFNGVNTTAPNCNGLINVTATNFGFYTIRGYANDSVGNFAVNTSNASVIYYNVTQSTPLVAEGGYSVFNLTVNMTNIPSITTLLKYNNTGYSPTTQTTSQNGSFSSVTLNIPAGLGNSSGVNQFWNWSVNLTGATNFTTNTYSQTILGVIFSNCSTGGVLVYNFTHYDEGTRALINFSAGNNLQVDLTARSLIDQSISFRYNTTVTNSPSLLVCLPTGVLNSTSYRVDLTGSYVGTGYVQEFFYIDNGTLSLSSIPKNFGWYDLDLDDSTTFLFTFLDENGIETPGVIVETLRKYIGAGLTIDVERSKEDNNGETHIHLVEEDVIYRFNITLQGQQIFLSEEYNAKCLSSPCAITLSAEPEVDPFPTTYNNLPEGSYQVSTNKATREVTLLFNLNQTGVMNLSVWTQNNNEAELVAQGTTTASSGSVTVQVPLQYGNATYSAVIYMGEEFVATRVVDLSEDASDYFGALGLFLGALAVLSLALIGASHGEWVIVWTVIGVLTASILFLVDLEWYTLLTFIAGAGIFLIKLVSRRRVS